ncbi:hypothetical protein DENSPDRAFT_886990 [Dentipellis sp. KUC8613]|nr:hypothetical protein DENSPDRAFT_886990 [Dentipellis sp. KUC8613]
MRILTASHVPCAVASPCLPQQRLRTHTLRHLASPHARPLCASDTIALPHNRPVRRRCAPPALATAHDARPTPSEHLRRLVPPPLPPPALFMHPARLSNGAQRAFHARGPPFRASTAHNAHFTPAHGKFAPARHCLTPARRHSVLSRTATALAWPRTPLLHAAVLRPSATTVLLTPGHVAVAQLSRQFTPSRPLRRRRALCAVVVPLCPPCAVSAPFVPSRGISHPFAPLYTALAPPLRLLTPRTRAPSRTPSCCPRAPSRHWCAPHRATGAPLLCCPHALVVTPSCPHHAALAPLSRRPRAPCRAVVATRHCSTSHSAVVPLCAAVVPLCTVLCAAHRCRAVFILPISRPCRARLMPSLRPVACLSRGRRADLARTSRPRRVPRASVAQSSAPSS